MSRIMNREYVHRLSIIVHVYIYVFKLPTIYKLKLSIFLIYNILLPLRNNNITISNDINRVQEKKIYFGLGV